MPHFKSSLKKPNVSFFLNSLTVISTLYFVERQPSRPYMYDTSGIYNSYRKNADSSHRESFYPDITTAFTSAKNVKPTKHQTLTTKDDGGGAGNETPGGDESNRATKWDESNDVELSSNSIIDGVQYNKKNESKFFFFFGKF